MRPWPCGYGCGCGCGRVATAVAVRVTGDLREGGWWLKDENGRMR